MDKNNKDNKRDNKIKFWEAIWPQLQQATKDAESHIDKKIYGIAAGGEGCRSAYGATKSRRERDSPLLSSDYFP